MPFIDIPEHYYGLQGAGIPYQISSICKDFKKITILCKDKGVAERLFIDLEFFCPSTKILFLPEWDTLYFEEVSPQNHISAKRISILNEIENSKGHILITTPKCLMQKVLDFEKVKKSAFNLTVDALYDKNDLMENFIKLGFNKVSLVEKNSDFAIRGNVIDFFPANLQNGIRLLFLENKLEKIKIFDTETQMTVSELKSFNVLPTKEFFFPEAEMLDKAIKGIFHRANELGIPINKIRHYEEALKNRVQIPGLELIQGIYEELEPVFSYFKNDEKFFIVDNIAFENSLDKNQEIILEREERLIEEGNLVPKRECVYLSNSEVLKSLENYQKIFFDNLIFEGENENSRLIKTFQNTELKLEIKKSLESSGNYLGLKRFIEKVRNKDFSICFAIETDSRIRRLKKILLDFDIDIREFELTPTKWIKSKRRFPVVVIKSSLTEGVQLIDESVIFISESEIFGDRTFTATSNKSFNLKKLMGSLAQLSLNDYVVHQDYGIGVYKGLQHVRIQGEESDFIQIDYLDSKLYLPVTSIKKLEKFVAVEGSVPKLDKLSSKRWVQTKAKIKSSVLALAGDLIRLYKDREVARGWRFEEYNLEDDRFADGFGYKETEDQSKAIYDTLNDMAKPKPMDRLICGDVGFGKTEVALRAAFKCVSHLKQVAILVPTTILVEQHRDTFLKRFTDYNVKIGAISRFYTSVQNKKTLNDLKEGAIDIIIGTHRLLQKDVVFKDLGLLIIDEEHRFGVKQKEKIKQMKRNVDVLTLTATPIPRTLNMAMLNIRDISVIATPPCNRQMIRTYVSTFKESTIRDAILREISRGGQVFFVHNRVQSIIGLTERLKLLVPEARFEYAHGQMSERKLEDITKKFFDHEFDVLVSTTIVENGLDLPNANTMIIDRADTFGLAQLYQLRGRVGRSSRQAYAYFVIPEIKKITATAKQRLNVIQSLDDLGLGFNLSMRDLEIRGAGNLLGKEQSGNVVQVGFELYAKILQEAVSELSGEELDIEEIVEPEIKTPFPAFIPDYYLPDIAERLILYQRISAIKSKDDLGKLAFEIEDRFGPIPEETQNLLKIMEFRSWLKTIGIVNIDIRNETVIVGFSPKANIDVKNIISLVEKNPKKYRFSQNQNLIITHGLNTAHDQIDDFIKIISKAILRIS